MERTIIWITTQFEAFHKWEEAPDDVAFLRDYHRHIFHVKIGMEVKHDDRDIEFFQFKRKVEIYVSEHFENTQTERSCEMMASQLLHQFKACFVQVSEDGENGAMVILEKG